MIHAENSFRIKWPTIVFIYKNIGRYEKNDDIGKHQRILYNIPITLHTVIWFVSIISG